MDLISKLKVYQQWRYP